MHIVITDSTGFLDKETTLALKKNLTYSKGKGNAELQPVNSPPRRKKLNKLFTIKLHRKNCPG